MFCLNRDAFSNFSFRFPLSNHRNADQTSRSLETALWIMGSPRCFQEALVIMSWTNTANGKPLHLACLPSAVPQDVSHSKNRNWKFLSMDRMSLCSWIWKQPLAARLHLIISMQIPADPFQTEDIHNSNSLWREKRTLKQKQIWYLSDAQNTSKGFLSWDCFSCLVRISVPVV